MSSDARRQAILQGAAAAADLHATLGTRDALAGGDRPVDVLGALETLGLSVLFRPLTSLLGAYLPHEKAPGVLITTRRDHHVQRFTAAHELGHHVLGHRRPSLDRKIGYVGRGEITDHPVQELEADAFANDFLLPKWLIVAQARRQGWFRADLRKADVVYQLSLRLGASYTATCWALQGSNLIDRRTAQDLAVVSPRIVKKRAFPGVAPDKTRHLDVWRLSERDRGSEVLGNPDDKLVLELKENVGSGYSWDVAPLESAGMEIEVDRRLDGETESIGSTVTRQVISHGPAVSHLKLHESRHWQEGEAPLNSFELKLSLVGNQPEGLPSWERVLAA
jgi:Zn-dependent peptidase ImmA (M78 family)